MNCSNKILNLSHTLGATLALQVVVGDDESTAIDLTSGWRFKMQVRSKEGSLLIEADSTGETPTIDLEDDGTATVEVEVPADIAPQTAVYDIVAERDGIKEVVLEGIIVLKPQITELE